MPSTPSFAASPQWETDSTTSGSHNNLVELEAELASTPKSEDHPYETFDEYMAKKRQSYSSERPPKQQHGGQKGDLRASLPHSPTDSMDNYEAEAGLEDRLHSSATAGQPPLCHAGLGCDFDMLGC